MAAIAHAAAAAITSLRILANPLRLLRVRCFSVWCFSVWCFKVRSLSAMFDLGRSFFFSPSAGVILKKKLQNFQVRNMLLPVIVVVMVYFWS